MVIKNTKIDELPQVNHPSLLPKFSKQINYEGGPTLQSLGEIK
jgi:hypothetical protein